MFIPTTHEEIEELGWEQLDIILITGDTYIDSSYMGVAVIGKVLLHAGYRVGIIAQPDIKSDIDITRLGKPTILWGVTSGSMDSMVSNYTASKKRRNKDDLTPGGMNDRRPDRALIVYVNLIRRYFKNTSPIVLGGIEASLRRVPHYDYWNNSIRRSILFDAKADVLVYGMGEKAVLELAEKFKSNEAISDIKGICYISKEEKKGCIELPSFEEVVEDKETFAEMFKTFYNNNDSVTAKCLVQKNADRYLIHNPPQLPLTVKELDHIYGLDYERDVHPHYKKEGSVRALETIRFSITTHRGCFGECNFCSIALHQGRTVISRSEDSILKEVKEITKHKDFKGIISDVGGPTANMYGIECKEKYHKGSCIKRRCLYPTTCHHLNINHERQIKLLRLIRKISKIKKVFVASGIRYDLVMDDIKWGEKYLRELVAHHISGQMKVAPEHIQEHILKLMGKTFQKHVILFRELFNKLNKEQRKKQFLTYYFIVAHPGCTIQDMKKLKTFTQKELRLHPEQMQIFTPTPSTYSTLMYWTGVYPFTGEKIFVERDMREKEKQKRILLNQHYYRVTSNSSSL